jgi:ferric-dicitrate binding protein FerR (iron transport regulator)
MKLVRRLALPLPVAAQNRENHQAFKRRHQMKSDRRAKVAAAATVVGLAALGGAALGSNHGLTAPAATTVAANGRAPIVTSASGSTTATATGSTGAAHHSPIVTRTSTVAGGAAPTDD